MYPGYSPADREQGKAAEEFGRYAAEARVKGTEFKHPDAAYEIGQSNIMKRGTPSRMGQARAAKEKGPRGGSGSGSGSEGPAKQEAKEHATTNGHARKAQVKKPPSEGDNPYFVIDTNPTPINLPGMPAQHIKRSASTPILVEGNEHKKAKKRHDGELPKGDDVGNGKTEDISEVVNARMKEKEEKRRHREEKKRKRESVGEFSAATEGSGAADVSAAAPTEVDKPKKKKAKKSDDKDLAARTVSKERTGEDEGVAEEGEGKKKKKRKKGKWIAEEV